MEVSKKQKAKKKKNKNSALRLQSVRGVYLSAKFLCFYAIHIFHAHLYLSPI